MVGTPIDGVLPGSVEVAEGSEASDFLAAVFTLRVSALLRNRDGGAIGSVQLTATRPDGTQFNDTEVDQRVPDDVKLTDGTREDARFEELQTAATRVEAFLGPGATVVVVPTQGSRAAPRVEIRTSDPVATYDQYSRIVETLFPEAATDPAAYTLLIRGPGDGTAFVSFRLGRQTGFASSGGVAESIKANVSPALDPAAP